MADWMIYLIKVACFQAVMVVFYLVFLRRLTFYGFNRVFLASSLVIGFLLPLLHVADKPVYQANQELVNMIGTKLIAEPIKVMEEVKPTLQINWTFMMLILYGLGVLLLTQRYLSNFNKIRKFKYGYELINKIGAIEVFRTPFAQPFSFFKSVFIPQQVEETPEMELVMAHELQHVRFGHSYDRMLVDFMIVLLWFNPFIYLLRKCLIEVHEYQVDAAVAVNPQSKIVYQMSLVSLAGGGFSGPVSFFNFSTIKRRIQMMNRNKSSKVSLISLTLLIPMLFGLVVLFSFKMKSTNEPLITIPSKTKVFTKELAGEKPSIFPVSTDEGKVKVSSTYGMRLDPFDKSKKMHHGMDIAAKSGTSVIATAGGEVIEVEVMPKGYGKYIVIKHDDTYSTKYAQLSLQLVKVGAQVSRGQKIGEVGSSGKSTAPHLHYEVIKNGKHVDPVPYISNYSFSQVPAKETKAVVAEQEQLEQAEKQRVLAAQQLTLAEQQRVEANHQLLLAEEARREAEEVRLAMVREEVVLKEQRALLEEQLVKLAAEPVEVKASEPVIVEVEEPVEVEVDPEIEVVSEVPVIQELLTDKDKDKNKSKDKRKNKSKDKDN